MPKPALAVAQDPVEAAISEARAAVEATEGKVRELRQRRDAARAALSEQQTMLDNLKAGREAAVLGHGTRPPSEFAGAIREASAQLEDAQAVVVALEHAEAQAVAELRITDEVLKEAIFAGWVQRHETLREDLMRALLARWPEYTQAGMRTGTLRWRLVEALADLAKDGRLAGARDKTVDLPAPEGLAYARSRLLSD